MDSERNNPKHISLCNNGSSTKIIVNDNDKIIPKTESIVIVWVIFFISLEINNYMIRLKIAKI